MTVAMFTHRSDVVLKGCMGAVEGYTSEKKIGPGLMKGSALGFGFNSKVYQIFHKKFRMFKS